MSNVILCLWGTGGFDRSAQGVVGAGQRLAETLGAELHAVVLGADSNGLIAALRKIAGRVHHADSPELAEYQPEPYLSALAQICGGLEPRAVLLGSDTYSQELTPRLAHRLGGSSMADGLSLEVTGDALRVARPAYAGRAAAVYELKRSPAVVWLRSRAMDPATVSVGDGVGEGEAEVAHPEVELPASRGIRIVDRQVEARDGVALEDARVVVSGGRGLGGPKPFEDLKKLAEVMGAAVGASRVACDEGWVPPSWQVGQTGKKVAPDLYLAVGISGAAQHLLGMSDSKVVAAINTDADAPIFKHCAFGLVEDYSQVIPALTEKLAELKK